MQGRVIPSPAFIYLPNYITDIYKYGIMDIQFLDYNTALSLFFCCSDCSIFGYWEFFQVGSCIFMTHSHLFLFRFFLTFWYHTVLQAHHVFPFPGLKISHFSKEPWFLSLENGIQKPRCGYQMCLLLLEQHNVQAFSMGRQKLSEETKKI